MTPYISRHAVRSLHSTKSSSLLGGGSKGNPPAAKPRGGGELYVRYEKRAYISPPLRGGGVYRREVVS